MSYVIQMYEWITPCGQQQMTSLIPPYYSMHPTGVNVVETEIGERRWTPTVLGVEGENEDEDDERGISAYLERDE